MQAIEQRRERVRAVGFDLEAQPREAVEACNLCGHSSWCTVAWEDRYGLPAPTQLCRRCGLMMLSPRMHESAYGDFYQRWYRPLVSAWHGRLIDAATVQDDQRVYADQLMRFLAPRLAGQQVETLLDVGGSTGVVSEAAVKQLGTRATVLDPSDDELAEAKSKGLDVLPGLIEHLDPAAHGQFDLVLLCQTIDHLLDVKGSLAKLRSMLKPEGRVYVDVVDVRMVVRRAGSLVEAFKTDHAYSLVRETCEAMLACAGLEIEAMMIMPDGVHVGYLCKAGTVDDAAWEGLDGQAMLDEVRQWQV